MKKLILLAITVVVLTGSLSFAAGSPADRGQKEDLLAFLENSYEVVGRYPEGGRTYYGTVTLTRRGDELVMTREIQGRKTVGKARIVAANADSVPVLQAEFTEGKQKYRATYILGSDLDNYARPSGWVYFAGRETKKPGMETLFILISPPEK